MRQLSVLAIPELASHRISDIGGVWRESASLFGMVWGRRTSADGMVSVMTGPATAPQLACVVDPAAPWVLLTDFAPVLNGWQEVQVPLLARQVLDPVVATVRQLGFEVLLTTEQFLTLAPELTSSGLLARQLTKRPDDRAVFPHARTPAARYRAFGLVVAIDLPHAGEVAQIAALTDENLDQALSRLQHSIETP